MIGDFLTGWRDITPKMRQRVRRVLKDWFNVYEEPDRARVAGYQLGGVRDRLRWGWARR